jgi:acyl-CoA synthetase (AMP-forming)/AMP-acid ligase II
MLVISLSPANGRMRMAGPDSSTPDMAAERGRCRYTILDRAAERSVGRTNSGGWRGAGQDAVGPLPRWSRISEAFFAAVHCFADRPALVTDGREYGYADLGRQALTVAEYLLSLGDYQPGDRVAVMADNGPEFIAAYYGVLAAGGVLVPLPPGIESNRLEQIAGICGVHRVLTQARTVKRRAELQAEDCDSIDLSAGSLTEVPRVTPLKVEGQSLAMVMFTSGSSGEPKGVMLSDKNLLANTESILRYLPITWDDRALALLPFYHAFGHSILQTHLLCGATLVVDGNMAFPNSVVDALDRHRATSFSAVPEGYYSLLTMSDLGSHNLPSLRYMSVAGGALKPDSVVDVAQRIAPAEFYVMYGQTEASARLAYLPADLVQTHPSSIGIAIPEVELRVLSSEGHEAKAHEVGELCARGANVMLGYWNDSQSTASAISDGWLRTGDLAARDENGLFYVKARKSELVKVQGYRIHPREVEDAISGHFPDVRVIVVPYGHHGVTRLALFGITGRGDVQLTRELRRVCARELPRYKMPSYVEVLSQAPLNASMKLDRPALRRRAEELWSSAASRPMEGRTSTRLSA